jgi:hypothetical protein
VSGRSRVRMSSARVAVSSTIAKVAVMPTSRLSVPGLANPGVTDHEQQPRLTAADDRAQAGQLPITAYEDRRSPHTPQAHQPTTPGSMARELTQPQTARKATRAPIAAMCPQLRRRGRMSRVKELAQFDLALDSCSDCAHDLLTAYPCTTTS